MKNQNLDLVISSIKDEIAKDGKPVRVEKEVAKEILRRNEVVVVKNQKYHFKIRDLGLGICELLPTYSNEGTFLEGYEKK